LFLITTLGFVTFAMDYTGPQNRLAICGILILTAVNFRWLITARLPSVSYLTFLDQFSIGGLAVLVMFVVWDAILGSGLLTSDKTLGKQIEMGVLIGFAVIYMFFLAYIIFGFVRIEFYKTRFQHESYREWRTLQKKKKLFSKGKVAPKKQPTVIKKTAESESKNSDYVDTRNVILVNEAPTANSNNNKDESKDFKAPPIEVKTV
jgi:hypothetical protein